MKNVMYLAAFILVYGFNAVEVGRQLSPNFDLSVVIDIPLPEQISDDMVLIDEDDLFCLTKNIFHEARDQPVKGQKYVALVTQNRVNHVLYPDTYCDVIYEPYQFSWTISPPRINLINSIEAQAWESAAYIAESVMTHKIHNHLYGVTHYHRVDIDPNWDKSEVAVVGDHVFLMHNSR